MWIWYEIHLFRTKSTCPPIDNINILKCSDIVYKYDCPCGKLYIGETKRRLVIRAEEHAGKTSPLMEHLGKCGENLSFGNFSVVAKRLYGRESRKRYDTLYIRYWEARGKAMNICSSSRMMTIF